MLSAFRPRLELQEVVVVVVEGGVGGRTGREAIFNIELMILATILLIVNLITPPKGHYPPTI